VGAPEQALVKATDIRGLDCEASALEGARLVLGARLEELCALRLGALDWSDIEGVHAMRVASRRLRSALRDFQPLLPKAVPRRRLKAIADALGAVRDMDVAIAELERLQAKAEDALAEEVEQLTAEHRSRREDARARLEEAITEETLDRLREKFIARLDEALKHAGEKGKHGKRAASSHKSFREFGHQLILSRFDELHRRSRSLYQPFETEPLHRMRIAAKRLRYALELFSPCWPGQVAPFAQEVAGLQRSLGELHDYDIWIAGLGERLDRLHLEENGDEAAAPSSEAAADSNAPQQRAAIWLFRHFVKERIKHFRSALARWNKWETTAFLARLKDCLEAEPNAPDTKPETSSAPNAHASHHEELETASAASAE
jgi:CHAD domain-containing protein